MCRLEENGKQSLFSTTVRVIPTTACMGFHRSELPHVAPHEAAVLHLITTIVPHDEP